MFDLDLLNFFCIFVKSKHSLLIYIVNSFGNINHICKK